jgi:hypothetical protein
MSAGDVGDKCEQVDGLKRYGSENFRIGSGMV